MRCVCVCFFLCCRICCLSDIFPTEYPLNGHIPFNTSSIELVAHKNCCVAFYTSYYWERPFFSLYILFAIMICTHTWIGSVCWRLHPSVLLYSSRKEFSCTSAKTYNTRALKSQGANQTILPYNTFATSSWTSHKFSSSL